MEVDQPVIFQQVTSPREDQSEGKFEILPHRGVDDEVGGGVEDEEDVVETGQAEQPVVGSEELGTAQDPVRENMAVRFT